MHFSTVARHASRRAARILVAAVTALSCSDSTGPDSRRGIQFVAGAEQTDTARAELTQALVVSVRDSAGKLAPIGTVVRFESVVVASFNVEVFVGALTQLSFGTFVSDETNDVGQAATRIRLGLKAGPGRVVVSVPTLGLVDTATFTITAGNPVTLVIVPRDTLLYAGRTYTVAARLADASGNPRDESEPATWSASGVGISISSSGAVTTNALGRYTISATAASFTANASVSVAPQFQLAAWQLSPESRIVSLELDGTNRRDLALVQDGGIGAHPRWIPGTNTIVYTTMVDEQQRLRTVDQNGTVSAFLASPPPTMQHQAEPTPTATGDWIFFSAFAAACGNSSDYCIHRAAKDGSTPTLLGIDTPSRQPAPSPDGSRVAFTRSDFFGDIRVFDLATSTVSSWSVSGQHPSWSPLGDRIAFVDGGRIRLINPDGSGNVALTGTERGYSAPPGWSPDGKWIIARASANVLDLVEVATGLSIPLPTTQALTSPSLK